MLHILILILKIAGILLAAVLLLTVLAVCTLLFVPLRYRGEAKSDGRREHTMALGKVSWLFGLVKATIRMKNGALDYEFRIAWRKLGDRDGPSEERMKAFPADKDEREDTYETWEEMETMEEDEPAQESGARTVERDREDQEGTEETSPVSQRMEKKDQAPVEDRDSEESGKGSSPSGKTGKKAGGSGGRFRRIFEKIKCTIRAFCDKIKEISAKKEQAAAFITDGIHRSALCKLKKEGFRLLRRLSPDLLRAEVYFGFEDPALTGRVLAGLGILYPLIGECVEVTPDFEKRVFEGKIKIRGRIFAVHLILFAANLFLCRDVRRTVKDFREFRL